MAPSTLRASGAPATDVTVVDISQSGVRIETEAELAVGEEISIGLSGVGARRAYVAWRRDGQYGCAFESPINAADVSHAFENASVVRLGSLQPGTRNEPSAAMLDLYSSHRHLALPLDAVLSLAGFLAFLCVVGWYFIAG